MRWFQYSIADFEETLNPENGGFVVMERKAKPTTVSPSAPFRDIFSFQKKITSPRRDERDHVQGRPTRLSEHARLVRDVILGRSRHSFARSGVSFRLLNKAKRILDFFFQGLVNGRDLGADVRN